MAGALRLLRFRGPNRYKSDYEISLFIALCGLVFTESVLNNEDCFLEEDPWQGVILSMIDPDSSAERSPIVLTFCARIAPLGSYFKDVTKLVCGQLPMESATYSYDPICTTSHDFGSISLHTLICKGLYHRRRLLEWRQEYHYMIVYDLSTMDSQEVCAFRNRIYGVYASVMACLNRLIGCICSSLRKELENEAQGLALQVLQMEKEAVESRSLADFYLSQKIVIARSIVATSSTWKDDSAKCRRSPIAEEHLIERWKFEAWCKLLDRSVRI